MRTVRYPTKANFPLRKGFVGFVETTTGFFLNRPGAVCSCSRPPAKPVIVAELTCVGGRAMQADIITADPALRLMPPGCVYVFVSDLRQVS